MQSAKDVARDLQVDRSRVLSLARQGRIVGAKKVGNMWVFPDDWTVTSSGKGPKMRLEKMTDEDEEYLKEQYWEKIESTMPFSQEDLHRWP